MTQQSKSVVVTSATMTMSQLKVHVATKVGKPSISKDNWAFARQMELEDPTIPTVWVSYWDNTNRIRVTMHEEVLKNLLNNPQRGDLLYKYEEIPQDSGGRLPYTRIVVIIPSHIEATF